MANVNIRTPRFFIDQIQFLLSRGTSSSSFALIGTTGYIGLNSGFSVQELFDGRPKNQVTFDTSADPDGDVLLSCNLATTGSKKSFIAILNHNLNTAGGLVKVMTGDALTDVQTKDGGAVDSDDVDGALWDGHNTDAGVNSGSISETDSNKTISFTPPADGSTIITFDELPNRYWGIQFAGADGTFTSTDLAVGNIMIGEFFDMPHSPELNVKRTIDFEKNKIQESLGGQRFSNMISHGKTSSAGNKAPFTTETANQKLYGGRMSYDMSFNYLTSAQVMPDDYSGLENDDAVVEDLWNKTNGSHLPFVFTTDKSSISESDYMFSRFGQDSLQMNQVAPDVFNIKLKIEEEF